MTNHPETAAHVEVPIQYWGGHDDAADEAFWVKEAMQGAVALWWHGQREDPGHGTGVLADVTVRVDRDRGVIVLTEIPAEFSADATAPAPATGS